MRWCIKATRRRHKQVIVPVVLEKCWQEAMEVVSSDDENGRENKSTCSGVPKLIKRKQVI